MLDIVFKGGRVIDGTGNPWFRADLGISGEKIALLGNLSSVEAERIIEVKDLIVAPGFIDCHSHSDWTLLANPTAESSIRQGVTTEIVGNCGVTYAPVSDLNRESILKMSASYQPEVKVDWRSFKEYYERIGQQGISINVACFVGHGTVRRAVMGLEDRRATSEELGKMKSLVAEALEAGALGLSTGLEFMPGRCADFGELVELVKLVAQKDRLYATHIRNRDAHFEEATEEALEVARKTGVNLQLSHLNVKPGASEGAWYRVMEMVESARKEGLDVATDCIPYDTGPGIMVTILPAWVFEGGIRKVIERLSDPAIRAKLKTMCDRYWLMMARGEWDRITLAVSEKSPHLVGKTFAEISTLLGKDPWDCIFDIMVAEGEGMDHLVMNGRLFSEEHVREMMLHPLFMLASDGWTAKTSGPLAKVSNHPNCFGWIPTILGYYVREVKLLRIEEAVRKMTSFPAQKFGLRDRGLLREGMVADIVVFDPEKITTESNYLEPHKYPSDIEYVMVNGKLVLEKGEPKGIKSGKLLIK